MLKDYEYFLENILNKLEGLGVDFRDYELDHIGYQASSDEDYDQLLPEFKKLGEMLSEELVGGR
ncbi:MAG: VOC family protein [Candidatus Dojkabacteria bacterium]|nr:VOC family protein [Candidatus Dojkabacteria bacterium]